MRPPRRDISTAKGRYPVDASCHSPLLGRRSCYPSTRRSPRLDKAFICVMHQQKIDVYMLWLTKCSQDLYTTTRMRDSHSNTNMCACVCACVRLLECVGTNGGLFHSCDRVGDCSSAAPPVLLSAQPCNLDHARRLLPGI